MNIPPSSRHWSKLSRKVRNTEPGDTFEQVQVVLSRAALARIMDAVASELPPNVWLCDVLISVSGLQTYPVFTPQMHPSNGAVPRTENVYLAWQPQKSEAEAADAARPSPRKTRRKGGKGKR